MKLLAKLGLTEAVEAIVSKFQNIVSKVNVKRVNVEAILRDKDGNIKAVLMGSNLVTNAGKAGIASRINGAGAEAAFTYIGIGTGATAANATDTTLQSEITTNGGERASATASRVTTDVTNDTARLVVTFSFTGSFTVTETAVFNAASSGTMLNRYLFGSSIAVVSGDSLQVTHTFDVD